jgi:hypothetical protein
MTSDLIERLKAALEGATPGPWTLEIENEDYVVSSASKDYMMCDTSYYPTALELSDARYVVAANPTNICTLLDRIASLEAALAPFAEVGEELLDDRLVNDEAPGVLKAYMPAFKAAVGKLKLGDFRRAARALDRGEPR